MKRNFTLAMLLLAFNAHAQQVHKCVGRTGSVAYQSQPCGAAQATARTWEAPPDPVSEPPASYPASVSGQQYGNATATPAKHRQRRVVGASIPVENSGNSRACASAKASRSRTLERVGLKRTFDLLRRLDDAVHRACK